MARHTALTEERDLFAANKCDTSVSRGISLCPKAPCEAAGDGEAWLLFKDEVDISLDLRCTQDIRWEWFYMIHHHELDLATEVLP